MIIYHLYATTAVFPYITYTYAFYYPFFFIIIAITTIIIITATTAITIPTIKPTFAFSDPFPFSTHSWSFTSSVDIHSGVVQYELLNYDILDLSSKAPCSILHLLFPI